MYQVFLVEDENNLREILSSYLVKEGWEVSSFKDGTSALQALKEQPHLWVLDIMLPDIDGYQLIRQIKEKQPDVPVIFISARDADLDRIVGLELGSDDYLAKPFLPRELVIRIHRLLERVYKNNQSEQSLIYMGSYLLEEHGRTVLMGEENIELTSKEFDLVLFFAKHKGQVLSREQIIDQVWGEDYFGTDRSVDDLVRRLRRKMVELRIETVYGYGYRMVGI